MRNKFVYWLNSYKSFSDSKAEKTATVVDAVSDEMCLSNTISSPLFCNNSFVAFAKNRKEILKNRELSQKEKKALSLYGDFLQFVEYSNFTFPELEGSPLLQYCKVMKMTYSYKPVLLLTLLDNDAQTAPIPLATVIQSFCSYYNDRLSKGLIAEKQNSLFAKPVEDYKQAKIVVLNNPVAVLQKDGVIVYDEKTSHISFASKYIPTKDVIADVEKECNAKLDAYYEKLADSQKPSLNADDLYQMLDNLSELIKCDSNEQRKNECLELINRIQTLWGENSEVQINGSAIKPFEKTLSYEDPRKVGKLVKEEMTFLSESGVSFSIEQVKCFTDKEWSKEHLHLYYSFFKKYDPERELNEQRRDHRGNGRYWNKLFSFGDDQYLITSEWYADSKPLFIDWYNGLSQ